jgi:hypothetical protein
MELTVRQTSTQPGTRSLWFRAKTQARPSQDYHLDLSPQVWDATPPPTARQRARPSDRSHFSSSPFQRQRQRAHAHTHPVPASHTQTQTQRSGTAASPSPSLNPSPVLLMLIPDPSPPLLPSSLGLATSRSGRCTTQTAEYTPSQPATDARAKPSRSNRDLPCAAPSHRGRAVHICSRSNVTVLLYKALRSEMHGCQPWEDGGASHTPPPFPIAREGKERRGRVPVGTLDCMRR